MGKKNKLKTQAECEADALEKSLELIDTYHGNNKTIHRYKCKLCLKTDIKLTPNVVQRKRAQGCPECGNARKGLWAKKNQTVNKNKNCKKVAQNLRGRFRGAMKRFLKTKKVSAVKDLGCSLDEFVVYFEKLFQPGMHWGNWGKGPGKWSMDHIVPLSSFDLENEEQQRKAVRYTNLQPLWGVDNIRKGAKIV